MLTKKDFLGDWHLSRDITDRQLGQSGKLTGAACFTELAGDLLRYDESGEFRLGDGPVMRATRCYQWRFTDSGVQMLFDDGRDFHSFVPQGYVDGTDHACGEDTYTVKYDFIPWPKWRVVWLVNGPNKDYTSVTEFTRKMG